MSRRTKIVSVALAVVAGVVGWKFRDWLIWMWVMGRGE